MRTRKRYTQQNSGKYIAGFGNKKMADVLYSYVYPELKDDVIQIGKGKNVNYETVLTTDADLAILPQRFSYMVEEFNAVGIPAIVFLTSKESYDTIRNALTLVGQVTGEEDRAAEIIAYFDGVINKLNERTASVTEKPSVMFLGSSNMYSVAPGAMIQSDIMETAGAVNAVTGVDVQGSFADVSPEEIVGWNPDIIWVPEYADYTAEDVLNAPEFQSIPAVQNGAVYTFPSNLASCPSAKTRQRLWVSGFADALKPADELHILESFDKIGEMEFVPNSAFIVCSFSHKTDGDILNVVLGKEPSYVGMLGGKPKIKALFTKLKEKGYSEETLMQVHAPIGLDIGGERPAEIAVSIMAEVLAARNGGSCRSMSEILRDSVFPL